MSALVVGIHPIASAGGLQVFRWDAATLAGGVVFGGAIGTCGGVDRPYLSSLFQGGVYFASVVPDEGDTGLDWAVFRLDVRAGAATRVLTLTSGGDSYREITGIACSADGEKVFVKYRRAYDDFPIVRSSDGGQSWEEEPDDNSFSYSAFRLFFDSDLDRLFLVADSDDSGVMAYSDDFGASWDGVDYFTVNRFSQRFSWGCLRQSKIAGAMGNALDTSSLSTAPIPGVVDVAAEGARGVFSDDGELGVRYHPFTGSPTPVLLGWLADALTEDNYESQAGSGNLLCFENPNGSLCNAYAPADWALSGSGWMTFVIEASVPTTPPFWRRLNGTREIP